MVRLYPVLGAVLAACVLAPGASAQSFQRLPASSGAVLSLGDAPAVNAPTQDANALVACAAGVTTVTQAFVTGATFIVPNGNTAGTAGAPQELGQSITSPCDGVFDLIQFVGQTVVAGDVGQVASGVVYFYDGAGTAGTLLGASPFSVVLPATGGAFGITLTVDAFPVTQGQVITAFVDALAGPNFYLQLVEPGTYADGTAYIATSGSSTGALPVGPGPDDLRFTAQFRPAGSSTQPSVYNGAGWRLLSSPVGGITVHDLATMNLVQGIPGALPADRYPAEYPAYAAPPYGANLRTSYVSGGTFTAPANTATLPIPGAGFFWYWYDQAFGPFPAENGTSQSRELTGFTLSASGGAINANTGVNFGLRADGFYMLGNPFALPLALTGVTKTAGTGTLGTTFQAYDPALPGYRVLFTSNPSNGGASDYAAAWQGFFGQVTSGTTAPTITYLYASTSAAATPPFYGRSEGGASVQPYVQFMLDGTTASGTHVADVAAYVRFMDDALVGWDANDMGKMLPPGGPYALLAPVGERDGAPYRLAVNSLPSDVTGPVTVPVAFLATEAGTFSLSWEGAAALPEGWSAVLTDAATGATVNLRTATAYGFAATAGDWAERFTLVITPDGVVTGTEPVAAGTFRLGNVAPNPTAGAASLALRVGTAQDVRATVYDALGRQVAVAFDGPATPAADVVIALDAAGLAPGAYVVRVEGQTFSEARRVTVVR